MFHYIQLATKTDHSICDLTGQCISYWPQSKFTKLYLALANKLRFTQTILLNSGQLRP